MPDRSIVVVGSVNVDMIVKGSRLPRPGETVIGGDFSMAAGGKGANQAVAAARLGAHVKLIAKVGQDMFGDQSLDNFRQAGIDVASVLRDPQVATGVALILIDAAGENSIAVSSGANARLSAADVAAAAACIRAADVLMLQLEIPLDAVLRAAQIAAAAGACVILDPAPAVPLSRELLQLITFLTPNEHEAEALTGLSVHDEATATRAAAALRDAGAQNAIITLGSQGALVSTADGAQLVPSHRVAVVDTTAAGDAFNGALACGLARGLAPLDAAQAGCLAAAISTTRLGAQPSLPTWDEVEHFQQSTKRLD